MKILQLNLIAFGLFTDRILNFSAKQSGLHIVYGINEAGKSSMRRAITYLLFGIPTRTADSYLHANDQLRIGAHLINVNGEELICVRRKGRKNTLLDSNNKPIDEKMLQNFLGGIPEAQFTAQCCFDHERLRQGGEDLLSGGGDIGESLFEAGTGSLKVHEVLADLDQEKDELFKARGSKPLLNKTIRDYKDTCKRIQEASLSAHKWSEYAKKLDAAQHQHTQLTQQLQNLRAEQQRLKRIQRTRPLLQRQQELKTAQASLAQVVLLPDDAAAKHFQAKLALRTAQTQEQQACQEINELQQQLSGIEVPKELIAEKVTIDNLREHLGSHQKAARDLPGVRTEMRTVEGDARSLLQRIYPQLDLQDITALTIAKPQREFIKRLANKYPALQEKQNSITKRQEDVDQQLFQQQSTLETLPTLPDLSTLRAILARACKHGDLEAIQTKDEQEVLLLTEQANIDLKQLNWPKDLTALEQIVLPKTEGIEGFERRFSDFANDQKRIKERLLEARERKEDSTQKINALVWAGEIPTEEALIKARQARLQYWQKIKQVCGFGTLSSQIDENDLEQDGKLWQIFEETMLNADELSDRLRREAKRVAEYSRLLADQQSAQHEQELQTKKWHAVETRLTELQREWENYWETIGIKPRTPSEMRSWLTECLSLRQQARIIRERHHQLAERQQLIVSLCQELTQTLTPLHDFLSGQILNKLADLIGQSNDCVTIVTNLQRQHENLQLEINNLTKEQQRTIKTKQQADTALKKWQNDWEQAISPLQLPANTPPDTARNVLTDLDEILSKIDKANSLRRRIELMLRDAEIFRADVIALAQKIAPELSNETAEQIVPALSNWLSQAEQNATRSEQLQQRLNAAQQRLTAATQQLQTAQTHLQALMEQARCNDVTTLEQAEQASVQKKEVQRELQDVEQSLLGQGEGFSLAELADAVTTVDIEQLPSQLQSCNEQIQQLEQERSNIDQSIGELHTLLKQMDGNANAAKVADEAQSTLAEIQNLSERYMQVHLAASVLRKSIERYREQNQGPLLQRASELFQCLTLNSFCGLKTDYNLNNDKPILLGQRTPNVGISTSGMSEGTRDQLYLALRLASIERHIEKSSPIPLILDDILINFDDERSQATLAVLGELSQRTQILFLTHHPRLVKLAQQTVPSEYLEVHQL